MERGHGRSRGISEGIGRPQERRNGRSREAKSQHQIMRNHYGIPRDTMGGNVRPRETPPKKQPTHEETQQEATGHHGTPRGDKEATPTTTASTITTTTSRCTTTTTTTTAFATLVFLYLISLCHYYQGSRGFSSIRLALGVLTYFVQRTGDPVPHHHPGARGRSGASFWPRCVALGVSGHTLS